MKAVSRGIANSLTRELAGWLEGPPPETAGVVEAWGPETWSAFRRVVTFHGLAPYLARVVPGSAIAPWVPAATLDWLAEQAALNVRRIRCMHEDLARVLAAAAAAHVEVMPLKGAILTTMPGADPIPRPMADLDVLVHPADRSRMTRVLEGLGYQQEPVDSPHPTHDVFVDPNGARVASYEGEHPDNPRRVELHVEVKRHLWGWANDDDLTALLWRGATPGRVLGEPASLPRPSDLLAHLTIHATSDLLGSRGRLVQWLDLAAVAPGVAGGVGGRGVLGDLPHPRLAYPSLRLAGRALPRSLPADVVDLSALECAVPARLARWAETVPLDGRCGLTVGRPPDAPASMSGKWERWRPERWRLDVAYGDLALPFAWVQHGRTVISRVRDRR